MRALVSMFATDLENWRVPRRPTLMACCALALVGLILSQAAQAVDVSGESSIKVTLEQQGGNWQLVRAGNPYYVKGAGGASASLSDLAAAGANSSRTWGVDDATRARLDEAHRNGLSVAVGIWIEHERLEKLDYSDSDQVEAQARQVLAHVEALKDHPAVLVWGIGNEMEADGSNVAIWKHLEDVARRVKQIDPNHPTMTVIAEAAELKIRSIHEHCPSIDIVGINAYGGAATLPERYRQNGGTKPYLVTEFGPVGTWEVPRNGFGAVEEASSAEKAKMYRKSYESFVADKELCLGSYAFLWGNKQEATATWFGMLLPDGKKLATADLMGELWTGNAPQNRSPVIETLAVDGARQVAPESSLKLRLKYSDEENDDVKVRWVLSPEAGAYITNGDFQQTPEPIEDAFSNESSHGADLAVPDAEGIYRVYVYVEDESHQNADSANIPIHVTKSAVVEVMPGVGHGAAQVELPLVVYDETSSAEDHVYVPSGVMGSTESVTVESNCKTQPKFGDTCMKFLYDDAANWAGLVWQHPANDWGDLPGGCNLSKAKKLSFWARGKSGGEEIKFGYGLLGKDKRFPDSDSNEISVKLTKDWVEYSIECNGDLKHIKSGFYWSLAGQGEAVEFYLDRIRYE